MRRLLVMVLVLALFVATTAAFALTEALKLDRAPVDAPRIEKIFAPGCRCANRRAHLSVHLRKAQDVEAAIVDRTGEVVRTLGSRSRDSEGRIRFRWNGKDDGGTVVPDGPYRLQVRLTPADRTVVIPRSIVVDTKPPEVELVRLAPRTFTPTRLGAGSATTLTIRLSERARPIVLVDGRPIAASMRRRGPGTVELGWRGHRKGHRLHAGPHVVTVRAADRAGNVSPPTREVEITVRKKR